MLVTTLWWLFHLLGDFSNNQHLKITTNINRRRQSSLTSIYPSYNDKFFWRLKFYLKDIRYQAEFTNVKIAPMIQMPVSTLQDSHWKQACSVFNLANNVGHFNLPTNMNIYRILYTLHHMWPIIYGGLKIKHTYTIIYI